MVSLPRGLDSDKYSESQLEDVTRGSSSVDLLNLRHGTADVLLAPAECELGSFVERGRRG